VRLGNAGAGAGASAGGFKGGIGQATISTLSGYTVEVVAAVNAAGSIVERPTGRLFSDASRRLPAPRPAEVADMPGVTRSPLNTTIGVVYTDAALTKAQCQRMAGSAHDGLAVGVRPAHLMSDGDTIFGLSTGRLPVARSDQFDEVLGAAADAFTAAVLSGLLAARSTDSLRCYRDVCPSVFAGDAG
jgi:putative pantetheine hydrolase